MMNGLLQDGHNGSLSSKRVITFLAFILCGISFIANLFWNFKIEAHMYDGMIYLTMAGLGFTVTEKFATINKTNSSEK